MSLSRIRPEMFVNEEEYQDCNLHFLRQNIKEVEKNPDWAYLTDKWNTGDDAMSPEEMYVGAPQDWLSNKDSLTRMGLNEG